MFATDKSHRILGDVTVVFDEGKLYPNLVNYTPVLLALVELFIGLSLHEYADIFSHLIHLD